MRSQDCPCKIYDKGAQGQIFLLVLRFSSVGNIPPMFHTRLRLHVSLTIRRNARRMRAFQKRRSCLENWVTVDRKVLSYFVSLRRDRKFCKGKLTLPGCQFRLNISLRSATFLITQKGRSFSFQIYSIFHKLFSDLHTSALLSFH
jgi:hypothetical protein